MTPRRGMLLGLGFTLEALRAAGLTDADLAAPAAATLAPKGFGSSGIYDIQFETTRQMIDVTAFEDDGPQYVPGVARSTVTFTVSLAALTTWHNAIMDGEPVQFSEVIGGKRLTCMLRVVSVSTNASVDSQVTGTVKAQVVGAPDISDVQPQAPAPPAAPPVKRGRRGMKLDGALID